MSNYRSAGSDLSLLYQARSTAVGPNTNFTQSGIDLAQTFEKLSRDQQIPDVQYKNTTANLSSLLMGNDAQYTLTADKLTSTRVTGWNTEIEHTFTVTFASAAARTSFFLYGGRIKLSASRTGGTASLKNSDWTNMLVGMGDVELGKTNTYRNNTITSGIIGSDDLTAAYQTLFYANGSGAYAYSANQVIVEAKETSTTVITFSMKFQDLASGNPNIDEIVDGTFVTNIDERKHPTQSTPAFTTITSLVVGT